MKNWEKSFNNLLLVTATICFGAVSSSLLVRHNDYWQGNLCVCLGCITLYLFINHKDE